MDSGGFAHQEREPTNPEDQCAVAIIKSGRTVGHVPFNIAPVVSAFLRRPCNKGFVEVTGNRVNQGLVMAMDWKSRASTTFMDLPYTLQDLEL